MIYPTRFGEMKLCNRYWCIHGNCEEEATCFSPFTFPKVVTGWCKNHAPRVWVTREELEKQIVVYEVMNT